MTLMSKDKTIYRKPGPMNYKGYITYLTNDVHILENVCQRCADNKSQISSMIFQSSVNVTRTQKTSVAHNANSSYFRF